MGSRVPPANGGSKFGFRKQENRVTIQLTSRSKQEIRGIKRKLVSELELVRRLVKKIEESKPLHQLNISSLENENLDKDKKTPKTNQFYKKSEILLAKDRIPATDTNKMTKKMSKSSNKKQGGVDGKVSNKLFKNCGTLLEKLMKHKHGWVFNTPVDPLALGLHDYFDIIKHPMDLSSVKSRLDKNWYNSPMEFAEDVRLTFNNAMTYNPKGQDVHAMAELLLKFFEEKWKLLEADYNKELKISEVSLPIPTTKQPPLPVPETIPVSNWSESSVPAVDHKLYPKKVHKSGKIPSLEEPKSKELKQREMTYDEKQNLSINLQNLPSEKLDHLVQIIKKRTPSLSQKDDEIEVDIDTFDSETLWELDQFVTNYQKSLTKNKRKAEFPNQDRIEVEPNVQDSNTAPVVIDASKEADERIISSISLIQMEENVVHDNKSSSSSSSSSVSGSSSSDSDSDSSSGAGSDAGHSSKAGL